MPQPCATALCLRSSLAESNPVHMLNASKTLAYILSAGRGQRLGGICKGRLLVNGEPLLSRQLDLLQANGISRTVVIAGYQSDAIRGILRQHLEHSDEQGRHMSAECIEVPADGDVPADGANPEASADIQRSVRAALIHAQGLLAKDAQLIGMLICLVDLPLLSGQDIAALLEFANQPHHADVVIPVTDDRVQGHPIWLSRNFVLTLPADDPHFSLRKALQELRARTSRSVREMPTASSGYFTDIDTQGDIELLRLTHGLEIFVAQDKPPHANHPAPSGPNHQDHRDHSG